MGSLLFGKAATLKLYIQFSFTLKWKIFTYFYPEAQRNVPQHSLFPSSPRHHCLELCKFLHNLRWQHLENWEEEAAAKEGCYD